MAYLGRFRLGQFLPLRVLCRDGNDTPTAPGDCPQAAIFNGSGSKVYAKQIPVLDRYGQTGLFGARLFLDATFSVGHYTIAYYYQAGSFAGVESDVFEIMPGGSVDGSIISMTDYVLPNARFLVHKLDSGQIFQGRNPSILTSGNPSTGVAISTGLYRF